MSAVALADDETLDHADLLAGVRYERRAGSVVLRLDSAWQVLSSAVLGGGRRHTRSLLHLQVPLTYRCDRPERDLRTSARALGLAGPVVGLMTAVDLARTRVLAGVAGGRAVRTLVTVGLRNASRPGDPLVPASPGTINAIILVDGRLREAAAVELAALLAEAKAATLVESGLRTPSGLRASGTSTDAVAVLWRGNVGREVRHGGAATELGALAGAMIGEAIETELQRRSDAAAGEAG